MAEESKCLNCGVVSRELKFRCKDCGLVFCPICAHANATGGLIKCPSCGSINRESV